MNGRDYFRVNNLDLMRLLLASSVFFHHLYDLSRLSALEMFHISSLFAVQGFFVISGFLVGKSFESSRTVWRFYEKRVRRVYPAYAFVIIATFVGLFALYDGGFLDYLRGGARYLLLQLTFLNFAEVSIPGIFEGNPLRAVNGALWTLKIEMAFYLVVPLIMLLVRRFGKLGQLGVLIGIYVLALAYRETMLHLASTTHWHLYAVLAKQLPTQLAFFIVGVGGYVFFDELKRVAHWVGPIGLLGVLLVSPGNPARPLLLGVGVLYLGVFFHYFGNFGRHGDFSYGTYIWHFPLIQTFIALGLLQAYPYASTAALIVLVLGMAVISWKFVERPFLLKKSHYVVAETEPEVGSGEGEEGSAVGTLHVHGSPPGKQLGPGTK